MEETTGLASSYWPLEAKVIDTSRLELSVPSKEHSVSKRKPAQSHLDLTFPSTLVKTKNKLYFFPLKKEITELEDLLSIIIILQ